MYAKKLNDLYKVGVGSMMGSGDLIRESEPYLFKILRATLEQTHTDLADTIMSLKSGQMSVSELPLSDGNNRHDKEKSALEAGIYAITEGVSLQSVQARTGANMQLLTEGFEQAATLLNLMQSGNATIYSHSDTLNVMFSEIISDQLKARNMNLDQLMQPSAQT